MLDAEGNPSPRQICQIREVKLVMEKCFREKLTAIANYKDLLCVPVTRDYVSRKCISARQSLLPCSSCCFANHVRQHVRLEQRGEPEKEQLMLLDILLLSHDGIIGT